jgi:hypothetical protein
MDYNRSTIIYLTAGILNVRGLRSKSSTASSGATENKNTKKYNSKVEFVSVGARLANPTTGFAHPTLL